MKWFEERMQKFDLFVAVVWFSFEKFMISFSFLRHIYEKAKFKMAITVMNGYITVDLSPI